LISRPSAYLPRLGLASLLLCLVSGLILSFYYRPFGNVFQNVEEITTLVPYGWFFRQFHYAAGQLFVILMLIHPMDHLLRRRYQVYSARQWTLLTLSLCLCFFALFTGFILKGDKEGFLAGQIFMHILKTFPFLGERASRLLIVPGKGIFFMPFLYHCFFLPLLIIYLIRGHIREWLPDRRSFFWATLAFFLYALAIEPHMDIPPDAEVAMVKGPWFFLGIQTLLKVLHPLLAGLLIPWLFVTGLLVLPHTGAVTGKAVHYLVIASIFFYGLLTLRAVIWGP
jgi:ubiquinol-cytochrome c reductase cytochrome b subunit